MFCTHCGMPLEEGNRFCAVCGKPAPTAVPSRPATLLQTAVPPQAATTDGQGPAMAAPSVAQDSAGGAVPPSAVNAAGVVPPAPPAPAFAAAPGVQGVNVPVGAVSPAPAFAAAPDVQGVNAPVGAVPPAAPAGAVPLGYIPAAPQPPYPTAGQPAQYAQPLGYPPPPAYAPFTAYAPAPDAARSSTSAGVPAYRKGGAHSQYRTPEQPPLEAVPVPEPEDPTQLLTFWQVVGCYLALFCLPIGNIIFACVWGFRAKEHPQRRMLALAALPFIAVGLIALFCVLLWATVNLKTLSITLR